MNSVQIHLALTHVPVILSLTGLVMLIASLLVKNQTVTRTSYILIAIAGVAALPVYFSGEATEEAIENFPQVGKDIIEKHEEVAKLAMISIALAGLMALVGLFSFRWQFFSKISRTGVLLLAITSGAFMARTAQLGGQIRHSEIRGGALVQNTNEPEGSNEMNSGKEGEKDGD